MASPSELSLDCKPHGYSMLLKSFDDHVDLTQKLEEALALLEEERFKIDGLKRELPLCMLLLTNAVEVSRQQLQVYRANQGPRPVLEEFMPLKNSSSYNSENKSPNISDKANWMTTAQLWSQTGHNYETKPQNTITSPKETDVGFNVISPKLALDTKQGNNFFPFSKLRNSCPSPNLQALPDLTIASAEKEMDQDHKKCSGNENGRREILGSNNNNNKISNYNGGAHVIHEKVKGVGVSGNSTEWQTNSNNTSNNNNTQKKARRCWSPDLHRRFVNALQMLGGSQVATPKQIRDLMNVDGLTNDEVKSHLQCVCVFFFFLGTWYRNTGFTQEGQVQVNKQPELRHRSWWSSEASGSHPNTPPQQQPAVAPLLYITNHLHIYHLCLKTFTLQQHWHHHHQYHLYLKPINSCTSTTKSTCTKPRHRERAHRNLTSGALEIDQRGRRW